MVHQNKMEHFTKINIIITLKLGGGDCDIRLLNHYFTDKTIVKCKVGNSEIGWKCSGALMA